MRDQTYLEPYYLYGEGLYHMTSVKEVNGTDSYLKFATKSKLCQIDQPFQDCLTEAFMNKSLSKCRCVPYGLWTIQVKYDA